MNKQIPTKIDDAIHEADGAGKIFGNDIFAAIVKFLDDLFGKYIRKIFGFELL